MRTTSVFLRRGALAGLACLAVLGCSTPVTPVLGSYPVGGGDAVQAPDAVTPVDDAAAAVDAAQAGTDVAQPEDVLPDVLIAEDLLPDVAADAAPDVAADVAPDVAADVAPDVAPDVPATPDGGGGTCQTALDCSGAAPYCTAGACVACNLHVQCPGEGGRCVAHTCQPAIPCKSDTACTGFGAVCDQKAGVCRECLSAADCAKDQICKLNQCMTPPQPCKSSKECPGALVCSGGACVDCQGDADCLTSQYCGAGFCMADLCKPGSECQGTKAATCIDNGSAWSFKECAPAGTCLGGACKALICTANAKSCQGSQLAVCDATGTVLDVKACPANQTCVGGGCVAVVCQPFATFCEAGSLSTCSADGTQWQKSACPGSQVCAEGACKTPICKPGDKSCSGNSVVQCDALGLKQVVVSDCAAGGKVCAAGACVAQVCAAGSGKCAGLQLSVCNADGMGWTASSCDDNSPCTTDSCDAAAVKCKHGGLDCNDQNPCTLDTCDGTCKHTALGTGVACDDGNACTSGEVCVAGACTATLGAPTVSTVAGTGGYGATDGAGSSATFYTPMALARLSDGSFVVADRDNNRIRKITVDGKVSTLAGTGSAGGTDGAAKSASFSGPIGVAASGDTVYVADQGNNSIRKISGGQVSTLAGSLTGASGFKDGAGSEARFSAPVALAVDVAGMILVIDQGNNRIRKISPSGLTTTIGGSGTAGYIDGAASSAQFNQPGAIAVAPDNSVVIGDTGNYRVRRISADGQTVTTVAGAGAGFQDGAPTSALFGSFGGLAYVGSTLFVSDASNYRIRAIAPDGTVSTVAGSGAASFVDGVASSAAFQWPAGLAVDTAGALWLADASNERIRKLKFPTTTCNDGNACTADSCSASTGACTFSAVAGGTACSDGSACTAGETCTGGSCQGTAKDCNDGNGCTADFCHPISAACEHVTLTGGCDDGDACTLGEHCVAGSCKADAGWLSTLAGGAQGFKDGSGTVAQFYYPYGLAPSSTGVYIGDMYNNRIRHVAADGTTTTIAGTGASGYLDGAASSAKFYYPTRLTVDGQGGLIIADAGNHRIRKLVGSTVSTVAGSGTAGYLDGPASSAQFNSPKGLAMGPGGLIYVVDRYNHRIRTIAADGTVGTFAGSGSNSAVDGAVTSASFIEPYGICVGGDGAVYVTDYGAHSVRRIQNGQVETIAGGVVGYQDGTGKNARFNGPFDCVVDAGNNVIIADMQNNRLRRIDPKGVVTTIAGAGASGNGSVLTPSDGSTTSAVLAFPSTLLSAGQGSLWLLDSAALRKYAPPAPDCDDGQACTIDACDAKTGACSHTPLAQGAACDDGKPCTTGETCVAAQCSGGVAKSCDDGKACTVDSCDPVSGCMHVWNYDQSGCCQTTPWQNSFDDGAGLGMSWNGTWNIDNPAAHSKSAAGALAYTEMSGNGSWTAQLPAMTLPSGVTSLTFQVFFDAAAKMCYSYYGCPCGSSKFEVFVGNTLAWSGTAAASWKSVTVDLKPYKGTSQTISFVFTASQYVYSYYSCNYAFASDGSGVFVDDVAINATCP